MGSGAGKSGSDITIGYRYFMALQMGLARGPIDELVEIRVGDKKAWPLDGQSTATDEGSFQINAPELFGGDEKEGGIEGNFILLMGKLTQTPWQFIVDTMGGRVPGFRGVVTMFYDGLICSLNPYPKPWKMRMRRTVSGWDGPVWRPDLATIWMEGGGETSVKAMNPAHLIYECATNRDWGRGLPRSFIDEASFTTAAQTLIAEGFGLAMKWNRRDTLSSFVRSVVDHIGGAVGINRATGLLTLKLIRDDYDPDEIPFFDADSGLLDIEESDTAARDNAVNEIIVKWKDQGLNEVRSVRVQNIASIQTLGCVNSQETEYIGIPTQELGARCAQRDLNVASAVLKKYRVKLDRRGWKIGPGDVFRVAAPKRGIQSAIIRAGKIVDGTLTEGTITIEGVLDVFGLAANAFVAEEPPQWTPPDTSVNAVTRRLAREVTYRELARSLRTADLNTVTEDQSFLYLAGSKPTPLTLSFYAYTHAAGEDYASRGTSGFSPSALLSASIDIYDSEIAYSGGIDLGLIKLGRAIQIGPEIARIDDISPDPGNPSSGMMTVSRGCVDTIPSAHAAGTAVIFLDGQYQPDQRDYAEGESVYVKMLSRTTSASLPLDSAPEDEIVISGRQGRPYPPGDVRIGGVRFGDVSSVDGPVEISWKHRDRKTQFDQLVDHSASSVGPEPGTTYSIRIFDPAELSTPVRIVTGIAGTSWTYTTEMHLTDGLGEAILFELYSVRAGRASFQRYRFQISHTPEYGYGAAYGAQYGN